ncbi:MAG: hypothetical protein SF069_13815 [Phycisphaerae bacterium]|nr:hypothetical protein [Phycisphaerae bacterium]
MRSTRRFYVGVCSAALLFTGLGCNRALGLQDWQRDLLSLVGSGIGSFLAAQSTTVRVERECFENGVQIDCASVPGG